MYLLDTNHVTAIYRDSEHASQVLQRAVNVADQICTTCIIKAELYYMAEFSDRREENLKTLGPFLDGLESFDPDKQTAEVWGGLTAMLFKKFGPKDKKKQRKTTLIDLGFSDNDLWIAAIAIQHKLTLVSRDTAFERVASVVKLKLENWF
jgi:tRNA(fMet)-specific endonuclease VapC